jgi:hypothetical protein
MTPESVPLANMPFHLTPALLPPVAPAAAGERRRSPHRRSDHRRSPILAWKAR